jgi:hypothetical protein
MTERRFATNTTYATPAAGVAAGLNYRGSFTMAGHGERSAMFKMTLPGA